MRRILRRQTIMLDFHKQFPNFGTLILFVPLTEQERQARYVDLLVKCKSQEGASDSDVEEMKAHAPPSTRQGQCLNACMMEHIGLVGDLSTELSEEIRRLPENIKRTERMLKAEQTKLELLSAFILL